MVEVKQLYGTTIQALDGDRGSVHDLYFDAQCWTVRCLIVDTGKWLPGRKVAVVPAAILQPWHGKGALPVNLTKNQITSARPDVDAAQPTSQKAEPLLHSQDRWVPDSVKPGGLAPPAPPPSLSEQHLHSTKEVIGYRLRTKDGEIGRIEDFVLDDDCSRILFLTIDLDEWITRQVLLSPRLISRIDWTSFKVEVEVSGRVIEASQDYEPAA